MPTPPPPPPPPPPEAPVTTTEAPTTVCTGRGCATVETELSEAVDNSGGQALESGLSADEEPRAMGGGFIFLIIVGVLIVVGLFVGGIIYSLKGGGFHHNPEIPWGYSPKARTASTGKPKEVAVQKDTAAA